MADGTDIQTYYGKVASQHRNKPKFHAELTTLVQPFVDAQLVLGSFIDNIFDLDVAVGVQLDVLGQWIGRTRQVRIPITGVYFSFDTVGVGFDQANWQGPFDSTTGIVDLDDDTYRALLRAKIVMNNWDGSPEQEIQALNYIFSLSPGTQVTLQDNQDMSMVVGISGTVPPAALLALLQNGEFDLRPAGVDISYQITSVNTTALFGFDLNTAAVAGFDIGSWSGTSAGVTPGQVTQFTYSAVTTSSASFNWIAPITGTGPITYQLQYRVASSTGAYVLAGQPTSSTTGTITGLAANQTYSVQVYAVGSAGAGPVSAAITVTTSAGAPAQVTGLTETSKTATSVSLTWAAIVGATQYTVFYRLNGSGNSFTTSGNVASSSATVSGLNAGGLYDFTVQAINGFGAGPQAAVLTVGTIGSAPTAPLSLAGNVSLTTVSLSWLNPASANGPFAYVVQYAANVSPVVYQTFGGTVTVTATGGNCTITGLSGATNYLFQVQATNAGGSGPFTTPLPLSTNVSPPNQVTGLIPTSTTSTTAALSWNAVVNAVTYQVLYRPDGTTTFLPGPVVTAPTTSAVVTGLISGQTYEFEVYAIGP